MHMADALISPIVGGAMWTATACVAAYSIKKIKTELDDKKIPLMGVMGAFIFAAQMINFSIPGTGSSGHLGGGLLLAILLGPYAGFLSMASVLLIQALFFADGGLLAFGCNVFNLGFYTCFFAYPLIFKKIIKKGFSPKRIFIASMISSIIGLQLGAFSVVLETVLSGKIQLPFTLFLTFMQPIHLAIGIVEGLVTAAVVTFVWKARPDLIDRASANRKTSIKKVIIGFVCATVVIGGVLSWFASSNPDGLEWSLFKTLGNTKAGSTDTVHEDLTNIQNKTAILPGYGFKKTNNDEDKTLNENTEKSISGLVGGVFTLVLAICTGFIVNIFKRRKKKNITQTKL